MKPNVGMVYPVAAAVTGYVPGTSITYTTGFVVAEARSATISWETADGEFYGDDKLLDVDNSKTGYTIDFEPTGLSDTVRQKLLGETASGTLYDVTDAVAPDVGFGFIRVMRDDSGSATVTNYEAWWFYKVKFSLNSEETATKEKNIEWRTPTLNGKGMAVSLDTGANRFAQHSTFATLVAAKAYLNGKANIS